MSATIRRAGPGDAPALLALAAVLARTQDDPDRCTTEADLMRAWLAEGAIGMALIAELEGVPVGYIAMSPSFESSHASHGFFVSDLVVHAAHRRRGIGTALLGAAAREAGAAGRDCLWWLARASNDAAHAFYRRVATVEDPLVGFAVFGPSLQRIAAS